MSEITPAGAANASAVSFAPETAASTPAEAQPHRNPAVRRCLEAYTRTYKAELARRRGREFAEDEAERAAALAYRRAIPDFTDPESIRDFIACVTNGLVLSILFHGDATQLLYAAQVAITARPKDPRPVGRPRQESSAVNPPPQPPTPEATNQTPNSNQPTQQPCLPEN